MSTSSYITWLRSLKERLYPWPKRKRLETPNTAQKEGQKSIEGTAIRPRQDILEDE